MFREWHSVGVWWYAAVALVRLLLDGQAHTTKLFGISRCRVFHPSMLSLHIGSLSL